MRRLPLLTLLLSGTACAQSVPTLTPPTVRLDELRAGYAGKQDATGAISLNAFPSGGRLPCTGLDDAGAFAAAIAATAAKGGGTVLVPNGSCRVSTTIVLPAKVRLVGLGPASQVTPTASMQAVVQVTGGQSAIENLGLQQSGTLAASAITIAKGDGTTPPVDLYQLTVIGFPKAVRYVSGDTVRVSGGFYLNNGVAFSFEPATASTVNHTISGGTLVQGGSGVDLPANISGTIYPHVEGLLIDDLQVVQGVSNAFCMRISAGVHIVWRGGMCAEARAGGYGFRLIGTPDVIRSVDIGDVFVGANPETTGMLGGVVISAPAIHVKLRGLHFSSWPATPIAIDGGSGVAQVAISMPSFDGTTAANDITASRASVTITQPQYDVSAGALAGTGGTITSWPAP